MTTATTSTAELTAGQGLQRSLRITVPTEAVAEAYGRRLTRLSQSVKVPGFRPGKVPAKVVKERFADQLSAEVARDLVQSQLSLSLKEHNLQVAGQPRVAEEALVASESAPFSFTAEFDVYPTFTPTGFTGLKLERPTAEPDDALVQVALTKLEQQLQTFAPSTAPAKKGDRLTLTGQGYTVKNGTETPFAGGDLQNFPLTLGSGQTIPGFEEGLLGATVGQQVDLQVTFPADYHATELAGQGAVFKLTVNAVEAPEAQPLTDASVKNLGMESLEQLKDILRKSAARDLAQAAEQRLKRQLLDALDAANQFDLPQGLVDAEHSGLWRAQLQELQQKQMPVSALGDIQQAIDSLKPLAARRVKLGLVLAAIAREQKLQVTDAELQAALQAQIKAAGPKGEQVREHFRNPNNREQLAGPILEDKVTTWLYSQATITDVSTPAQELLTELQ
jgi:trigger factor